MLSAWGCLGAGGGCGALLRISKPAAGSLLLGLWTVMCWRGNQEGAGVRHTAASAAALVSSRLEP